MSIVERIKGIVPIPLVAATNNCGGVNRKGDRFAGHLLKPGLTDAEYVSILFSLIFTNGVRKTTTRARNTVVFEEVASRGLFPAKRAIRVLDIGSGTGLDALSTRALLAKDHDVTEYVLGDLHTHLLFDPKRKLIYDEDGKLLQVASGSRFVSVYFSYNYWFQRYTNLPKRIRPWLLEKRYRIAKRDELVPIPLVHPELQVGSSDTPFHMKRMNVFEPLDERFDVILCMHLLVKRYFTETAIEDATMKLARALHVGGTLVVGALEDATVIVRRSENDFERTRLRR